MIHVGLGVMVYVNRISTEKDDISNTCFLFLFRDSLHSDLSLADSNFEPSG